MSASNKALQRKRHEVEAETLDALGGLSRRRRALVAVSGGCDSMVLLHLLHGGGFKNLVVVHLNHQLRGRDSAADARLVAKIARRLRLPLVSEKKDTQRFARRESLSLEAAGRRLRRQLFAEAAREHRCRTLFLGHNADDRAETLLINLLRGTSRTGLTSLAWQERQQVEGRPLLLIRPLLGLWRDQLREFAKERRIPFRDDESNVNREFFRNRVRHEILPFLEEQTQRPIRKLLWRTAETLAAEETLLEELTPETENEIQSRALKKLPLPLQRRLIRKWLAHQQAPECGFQEIEAVRSLITADSPAKVNLPGNFFARRRSGRIFIERSG